MITEADAVVGNWYQHRDKGQKFFVVAVDEDEGVIEVQYFDGSLEEIERRNWYGMELDVIDEPENWSGALDIAEPDDLGTSITDTTLDDWQAPFEELNGGDGRSRAEERIEDDDHWGEGHPLEEPWQGA